jgi:uncharacterized protein with HEPN domain
MPADRDDRALLWDILDAARKIRRFVVGRTFHEYETDDMLQAAVERKIEIIGEAARGVSPSFQAAHPEVPWRAIIAQRHVLAHEYGEIRQEKLWHVASVRVPELIALLEPLLPPPPREVEP